MNLEERATKKKNKGNKVFCNENEEQQENREKM
jgi:hypothetical protein